MTKTKLTYEQAVAALLLSIRTPRACEFFEHPDIPTLDYADRYTEVEPELRPAVEALLKKVGCDRLSELAGSEISHEGATELCHLTVIYRQRFAEFYGARYLTEEEVPRYTKPAVHNLSHRRHVMVARYWYLEEVEYVLRAEHCRKSNAGFNTEMNDEPGALLEDGRAYGPAIYVMAELLAAIGERVPPLESFRKDYRFLYTGKVRKRGREQGRERENERRRERRRKQRPAKMRMAGALGNDRQVS